MRDDSILDIGPRLGRIEQKVDNLSELVVQLARLDERMAAYLNGLDHMRTEIDKVNTSIGNLYDRMRAAEQGIKINAQNSGASLKVWWLILSSCIGGIITLLITRISS